MQAQRKIQVVTEASMEADKLYRTMKFAPKSKLEAMRDHIREVVDARTTFEAGRERRLADGSFVTGQSADIKHVQALADSDAFVRLCVALKLDPVSYIYPQSQEGGKSSSETSNLKAYKKAREVAEVIWSGSSTLENVARVFAVCAHRATEHGMEVLKRDFAECFLSSREFRTIDQGTDDFWSAIDDVRAKQMTTGTQTQTSQMVRTLVALKSAEDVRDGRAKNTRIFRDGLVLNALMRRFGQVSDEPQADAAE